MPRRAHYYESVSTGAILRVFPSSTDGAVEANMVHPVLNWMPFDLPKPTLLAHYKRVKITCLPRAVRNVLDHTLYRQNA